MPRAHVRSQYSDPKALLLISLALAFMLSSSGVQAFECPLADEGTIKYDQCRALKFIYEDTDGPNWRISWAEGPRCGRDGIVCSYDPKENNYNVKALYLSNIGMNGKLPAHYFSQLPFLEEIDMSFNSLTGEIPEEIADLPFLHLLFLTRNNLSGSIPEELLGHNATPPFLSHVIDLANNNLSGGLPNDLGTEKTIALNVSDNPDLRGPIPSSYIQLNKMLSLSYLDTQICEPQYKEMQDWLNGLDTHNGTDILCDDLKPGFIDASDGTSAVNLIVKWGDSNVADYYVLQRAEGKEPPFNWTVIEEKLPFIDYCDGGICRYYDQTAIMGPWYSYRVKGCLRGDECSEYTNYDAGKRLVNDPRFNIISFLIQLLLYD